MIKISNITKQIIYVNIALAFVIFGIGSLFVENILPLFLGLLLGTIFSVLKLILIEITIKKSLDMPQERAVSYARLHYTLRFMLSGAVLLVAALNQEKISLIATIISLIILSPATHIVSLKEKLKKNN